MKLNVSYPATGCQKLIEIEDENKLRVLYDRRISAEVEGESLGEEFKGYIFRISGGNDKQGFAMKQGVLTNQRVRLLFRPGMSCYRPRKRGERKRKSVRGCIVSSDLSVINLVVIKKGETEIEGVTDTQKPRRLGPKRASKIRKLFNLTKATKDKDGKVTAVGDDVRKYVVRRTITKDGKKPQTKAPKIQRLVTPARLQHRRQVKAEVRRRYESTRKLATEYNELVARRHKEAREARSAEHQKRRSESRKASEKVAAPAAAPAKAAAPAAAKVATKTAKK